MNVAFWFILAALLAPYILSVLARSQSSRSGYVADPRAYSERLAGWGLFIVAAIHGRA